MAQRLPASALLMPLAAVTPILMAVSLIAANPDFQTNPAVHWVLQLASALILTTCAVIIVRGRGHTLNTYDYLLVTGLVCAAILEAAHGMLISTNFRAEILEKLIPWGWLPSRLVLPVLLIAAILNENLLSSSPSRNKRLVSGATFLAASFTTVCLYVLIATPERLPQMYHLERTVHRPSEFFPALLFFLAMASQLIYSNWRSNI